MTTEKFKSFCDKIKKGIDLINSIEDISCDIVKMKLYLEKEPNDKLTIGCLSLCERELSILEKECDSL